MGMSRSFGEVIIFSGDFRWLTYAWPVLHMLLTTSKACLILLTILFFKRSHWRKTERKEGYWYWNYSRAHSFSWLVQLRHMSRESVLTSLMLSAVLTSLVWCWWWMTSPCVKLCARELRPKRNPRSMAPANDPHIEVAQCGLKRTHSPGLNSMWNVPSGALPISY